MQIAIVDDSASSLRALEGLVRAIPGCDVTAFRVSAQGLAWCLGNDPDLILVDYHMPAPDGLQFIELFRRDAERAEVPIIMVTTSPSPEVRHRALQIGATDFLIKPVERNEFVARVRNLLKLHQRCRALSHRAEWLADEVRKATRDLLERERETVLLLSRAAEHRDPETGNHLVRMANYSRLIAEALQLRRDEIDLIFAAAPMHDVGKIGIPDHILLKPAKLTPDEFAVMKRHTVYGRDILAGSTSPLLRMAAEIAVSHHERFDGSGYPQGVAGEAIPLVGRIIAVADVFDALTSDRPYKAAWPADDAYDYLLANRGTHFDPVCIDAFCSRWVEVRLIAATHRDEVAPWLEQKEFPQMVMRNHP